MKILRIAFELYEVNVEDLTPGHKYVSCHIIFDVKMGYNFRLKTQMVSGGHKTTTQYKLTYQSSVSWDSVKTALTISALNDLKVIVCDTQNAYLTENFREKIWTVACPKFGYEQ